eukprot:TRINITY_DN757_c0_g1_i1.p1 TRINITY_DN757_c0_g1~~TRINITY_DN757_c0_g1_i1.p1  ORF type:complete len:344 (-),score=79.23 TRINITY_DN757_c0_g1_i1:241-1272(-)
MRKRASPSDDSDYEEEEFASSPSSTDSSPSFRTYEQDANRWDQKEWNQFVEMLLEWVNAENPTDPRIYCKERAEIPIHFQGTLCYIYKGKFLPSGNKDGLYWRPSQGATPTGNRMLKRYFYSKTKGGDRIKRQLSCLEGAGNWWFVDYRVGHLGATISNEIQTPNSTSWNLIVSKVQEFRRRFQEGTIAKIESDRENFVKRAKLQYSSPFPLAATVNDIPRRIVLTMRKSTRANPEAFKNGEIWEELPHERFTEKDPEHSEDSTSSEYDSDERSSPICPPTGSISIRSEKDCIYSHEVGVNYLQLPELPNWEQFYREWGYLLDPSLIPAFTDSNVPIEKVHAM